jgi:peptidoglycan hydrolase-like protein with peptidoglycan-binding domain
MPDLKRGSTGSSVKRLQQYLGVDPATGTFGPATEEALKAWQIKNGQAETGIATPQIVGALAYQFSQKVSTETAEAVAKQYGINPTAPVKNYEDNLNALINNKFQQLSQPFRLESGEIYDNVLAAQSNEGSVESGIYTFDSLLASMKTKPQTEAPQTVSTVQSTTTNINNAQTTLNTANNTTNNLNQAIDRSRVETSKLIEQTTVNQNNSMKKVDNLNSILTGPEIKNIQNKTEQAQNLTTTLTGTSSVNQIQTNQATTNSSESARVENTQLITKTEASQIINPPNPIVGAVETMGTGVKKEIQNMSTDLSTNISNMKSGDTVSNSQVTQVDQSSIYNTAGEKSSPAQVELAKGKAEEPSSELNLNEVYLSAIYEALVAGIKVKISS